jgi:hypothetical protein
MEHFILKDDGKIYHVEMPTFPSALNQFDPHDVAHYENVILKSAIDSAVEVSNQEEVRQALLKALNWNPDPSEHRFDIGVCYSLQKFP